MKIVALTVICLGWTQIEAQVLLDSMGVSDIFTFHCKKKDISFSDVKSIYGPTFNLYSSHYYYKTIENATVEIHLYKDSTILYNEIDANNQYITSGELLVDKSKLQIGDTLRYIDTNGRPAIHIDTTYALVKNGLWYLHVDMNTSLETEYKSGEKHGEEKVLKYINAVGFAPIVMERRFYENDVLTEEQKYQLPSGKKLTKLVEGDWYLPLQAYWQYKIPQWIYVRSDSVITARNGTYFTSFGPEGIINEKRRLSCGVGSKYEKNDPSIKWRLEENNLFIGPTSYKIIYIDEEIMILE